MVQESDRIRSDIESTRSRLTRDVDLLADQANPKRVAERTWGSMRDKIGAMNEKFKGSSKSGASNTKSGLKSAAGSAQGMAHKAGDRAGAAASDVAHRAKEVPGMMRRQTEDSPVRMGLIAFGAGLVAAAVIPESSREERLGRELKDRSGGLVEQVREPVTEAVRHVKEDTGEAVREAADNVKSTAKDAASNVKDEAGSSTSHAAGKSSGVADR
ncbi:uncharacterized protein DUF3618 [Stackebrandtia albiflava]|uniref:Uncharacterized protein DUF3618 n=1 Tax=Stackebrandtia albiflava TaxID=406432 RepID=A0A562V5B0_9ACTN|nr:DUF3618 domain-containing protein [Stackebrandtia albiflava]TWJ13008.1 uncharacterized protein DUF3618 [Stackebrandtia albiflava]